MICQGDLTNSLTDHRNNIYKFENDFLQLKAFTNFH